MIACPFQPTQISPGRYFLAAALAFGVLLWPFCSFAQTSPGSGAQTGPVIVRNIPSQKAPDQPHSRRSIVPRSAVGTSIKPQQVLMLPAFAPDLIVELKRQDEGVQPLRIGFGRLFDQPIRVNASSTWSTASDGSRIGTVQVSSPGAFGVRLHLEDVHLPDGARISVYDPSTPNPEAIPLSSNDISPGGEVWMPTVFAETVVLECEVPASVDLSSVSFSVTGLSHLYRPFLKSNLKAACEYDVTCYPAWANEAAGVAMISFIEAGNAYQCSGCLLNDSDPATFINYFLTAHHCIGNQTVASTIEFDWFYQSETCNGAAISPLETVTYGGADLLATSSSSDFAFLRLRYSPPGGVYYLGWSLDTPAPADSITGIHHPMGQPKSISFGNPVPSLPGFWQVQWYLGVTEGGSSGSPLLNANKQVIGQLYGGLSSCVDPLGIDRYGRFDVTYRSIFRWIDPSNTVINPFIDQKGVYNGIFAENAGVALESSGFAGIKLNSSGTFTGSILLTGKRYALSGKFPSVGSVTNVVPRLGKTPLTVSLAVDLSADANRITGTITDGSWTAHLTTLRGTFDRLLNPAPWAGNYTIVFPGRSSNPALPAGNGYGTAKVDALGNLRLVASLADKTAFTQSVPISSAGDWALYGSLYGGTGLIVSWMLFDTNQPTNDVSGPVSWIKKPQTSAALYGAGFTNEITAIGSAFRVPTNSTTRLINATNASVQFLGGNLASGFTNRITIAPNNSVTNNSTNKLTLVFVRTAGLFNGTVSPPGVTRGAPFHGVVFQKRNGAYGYLAGTNQSSSVVIGL